MNRIMNALVPASVKRTFTAKRTSPQARGPRPNNGRVMNRGVKPRLTSP
jgi:hypothetical protein